MIWILRLLLIIITIAVLYKMGKGGYDDNNPLWSWNKKCCLCLLPFVLFILTMTIEFIPSNNVGVKWSS